MSLNTELNLADPDAFYERLIELHSGLSDQDSFHLNEKLVEALSRQVPEAEVLREAVRVASAEENAAVETPIYVAKLVLLLANHVGDSARIDLVFEEGAKFAAELASRTVIGSLPSYCGVR